MNYKYEIGVHTNLSPRSTGKTYLSEEQNAKENGPGHWEDNA